MPREGVASGFHARISRERCGCPIEGKAPCGSSGRALAYPPAHVYARARGYEGELVFMEVVMMMRVMTIFMWKFLTANQKSIGR